jgi:sphingomyelin phosphodiesterase acid-like 3
LALVGAAILYLAKPAEPQSPTSAPSIAGQALVMSDLHFDPMADPRLVDQLAAEEPEQWREVLERSDDKSLGRYGRDANWPLLRSAFQQMRETLPDASFVLISGDFLAHNFRREFDAAASNHSDAAYRAFVRKTMQFLSLQLSQALQRTPILPALGNNDEDCGDYELQPGGPFLADTLPTLHALIGNAGAPDVDHNWVTYGNYSAKVAGIRVLSTNTNFFSIHYRNACGSASDADPGRATLAWLERELAAARQAQEHVWLVYHIPPGIDGYETLKRGMCPGTLVPMWAASYAEPFYALLRQYANTVVASFAGHTHMDDFRLIGDANGRYAFTLITPAISPIFGQNPAFRTISYDTAGGIRDQTTYDLTNLQEATEARGVPPKWRAEYTFTRQWQLPAVDLPSLDRLYSMIQDVPADRERWHQIFPVSSPVYWPLVLSGGENSAQAINAFGCATGNVLLPEYRKCYCGGGN